MLCREKLVVFAPIVIWEERSRDVLLQLVTQFNLETILDVYLQKRTQLMVQEALI